MRSANERTFSWFSLRLGLLSLLGLLIHCPSACSKRQSVPSKGKPTEWEALKAVREGGTIRDIYLRLLKLPEQIRLDLTEWKQIVEGLGAAAGADPPVPSDSPGVEEIFWSVVLADLRGGPWRDQLPGVYRSGRVVELLHADLRLCGVAKEYDGRRYWDMLRHLEGHPYLGMAGVRMAIAATNEWARELPPGWTEPVPGPPVPARPRCPPADRSYLVPEEVRRLVKREPSCLESKWGFTSVLPRSERPWLRLETELRGWLLEQGVAQAEPLLRALNQGVLTPQTFRRKTVWDFGGMEDHVLAEWIARGPEHELSPGVARWLKQRVETREEIQIPKQKILQHLPRWTAVFPDLKAIPSLLLDRSYWKNAPTIVPSSPPWATPP